MATTPATDSKILIRQLGNLANMAERVATPEFKSGFKASVVARAKAANSFLTYRDQQGRLVREWPATGRVEILAA